MSDFDNKQICSYKDIDRFGFTCDVCGRKINGCSIVNGMKFCAKCYQETFGKDNQQNEIQQLKQQLAEKQNTIDEINKKFVQAVHDWKALCAEKDKEIEKLKQQYTILENENGKLTTELIMDKYKKAQKEVSFGKQLAIQELEKTLNFIENVFDKALKNCSLNNGYYDQILDFIDQQIKELREE